MKTDFSGYGYTGAGNAMRGGGSHLTSPSHLSAYTPLSPLPVKSDLLTPSYQTYAQFGKSGLISDSSNIFFSAY